MRVPHYLTRTRTGFTFRITVPAALRPALGRVAFKRTLYTLDPLDAAQRALGLARRYAWAFGVIEAGAMAGRDEEALKAGLAHLYGDNGDRTKYTIKTPDGLEIQTDGSDVEHNRAAAMVEKLTALERAKSESAAAFDAEAYRRAVASINAPAPAGPAIESMIAQYYAEEGGDLSADTLDARQRATDRACAHPLLKGKAVDAITRADAAAWLAAVRNSVGAKSTAQHYGTHLKMIWKWIERKGVLNHGAGQAIWAGHFQITSKEKRRRKAAGGAWRPFTPDELQMLFAPENLAKGEKEHIRWGMIFGLYTGARVGEVAQIYLRDFVMEGGVRCLKITDESEGQQLKTDASRRLVPLHPDLIRLGLDDLITRRKAAGEPRLFDVALHHKAGVGSTISKGFTNFLKARGIVSRKVDDAAPAAEETTLKGRVGFHSFRKTVIQKLQGTRVAAERRRAFVGHEAEQGDTHELDYMRAWTARELKPLLTGLDWGKWLEFDALTPVLASGDPPGRAKVQRTPYAIRRAAERAAEEAKAKKRVDREKK